ncbi:MAG: hypothetical protein GF418_00180 [Chitinivibrionales bacterium]|nr:hypothetical protein [Chitinivibrionales bacterium]MBD3394016.1 hypothetical protein [Chitinivibrionales bacterium]
MNIMPVNQGGVAEAGPAKSTSAQKDDDLLKMDGGPEWAQRKRILETVFGAKNDDDSEDEKIDQGPDSPAQKDTVELSSASMELSRRQELRLSYEKGGERLEINMERVEAARLEMRVQGGEVEQAEPLVLDLNGNGLDLTDVREGGGVKFDITGDGVSETVSWVAPSDGFLVYDRNGNGLIDSGRELFGDQHGAAHGFAELAKFDGNGDGAIDAGDSIFNDLRVWQDLNANGTSEKEELSSLTDTGIQSIGLNPDDTRELVAGNLVAGYAQYQSGEVSGRVGEVFLNYVA